MKCNDGFYDPENSGGETQHIMFCMKLKSLVSEISIIYGNGRQPVHHESMVSVSKFIWSA